MTKTCPACGKAFTTYPSWVRRESGEMCCSYECRSVLARRNWPACPECGALMSPKNGRGHCSSRCRASARVKAAIRYFEARTVARDNGCIEWVGSCYAGYGRTRPTHDHGFIYAHRFAWELAHGPIPNGLAVIHRCGNRLCVNPAHLLLGTGRHVRISREKTQRVAA